LKIMEGRKRLEKTINGREKKIRKNNPSTYAI
jgi:hypothetical protein